MPDPADVPAPALPTPRKRGRRAGGSTEALSRDRVVTAALQLLDRAGLDAFSVRDLAKALDVYPAAIYWHVGSRNQLLAAMVTQVLREVGPEREHEAWQDWLRDLFHRYRRAIQGCPAVAPLIGAQLVSNAGIDLRLIERVLAVLSQAGFAGNRLRDAFNVVTAAQVGFVTMEFAPVPTEKPAEWAEGMRRLVNGVDRDAFPLLGGNLDRMANRSFTLRWENGTTAPMDGAFALYVETVVAGLERLAAADVGIDGRPTGDHCPPDN